MAGTACPSRNPRRPENVESTKFRLTMMLPSFLDIYLCFGLISVLHWTLVIVCRSLGIAVDRVPH